MRQWPATIDECTGCGCDDNRRAYGGRGYCGRCFYYIKRSEAAQGWTFGDPKSFGQATCAGYLCHLSRKQFEAFKTAYLASIKRTLRYLQERERRRKGKLEALDLENKFAEVLRRLNRKAQYQNIASYLAMHFNKGQLTVIYTLLDDIIEAADRNSDRQACTDAANAVNAFNLKAAGA